MSDLAIKIDNVSKEYRLGAIGGGTLRGDLQSFMAKVRHKEDPNLKIGESRGYGNERFLALEDVSFDVKKGEIVGIIGHNGAGKSTLLKLLSRVTAPTRGEIGINGRIASMLEVGTGFHPELTGRENVYMNGAILGMTKAEITRKFDEIVEFAEMSKFIDTPVKRYSSGMYVKLAFAVAAHLDSEILVMDEVLAVGDMKFQEKCLGKMSDVSNQEGKTVLYVSHNMNTIKNLCERCVVLDHGHNIFDGDVPKAISIYSNHGEIKKEKFKDFTKNFQKDFYLRQVKILSGEFLNSDDCVFSENEKMRCLVRCHSEIDASNLRLRVEILNKSESIVGVAFSEVLPEVKKDKDFEVIFSLDISSLGKGEYHTQFALYRSNEFGVSDTLDLIKEAMAFDKVTELNADNIDWYPAYGGYVKLNNLKIL